MDFLFITPFYKPAYVYGGPTRSIPGLCEGLVKQGCTVEVFTTDANGETTLEVDTGQPVLKDGVRVTHFAHSRIAGRFFYSSGLRKACNEHVEEFDYVYVYGIWNYPAIAAGAACRRREVSYIVSPRTGLMQWPLQQGWLRKKLYLWLFGWRYLHGAWAMHYTTQVERKESEQTGVNTPGFVVPNCMDFSEFDILPGSGSWRRKVHVSSDAPLLLFLGRLEPRKGVGLSLRAFSRVKDEIPQAHFAIAGPGEEGYVRELKALASDLGITDAVTFTGYVDADERLEALVDADVFVLTSHTENFAMAAVEAMAAETPVLLSEEVGVAEKAEVADAGISVSLDEMEIADELGRLLESETLREKMGQNGPFHVRNTYSREAVGGQMIDAIRGLQEGG
jgi:glycosyltransferase involved in cell wall biosynthesis